MALLKVKYPTLRKKGEYQLPPPVNPLTVVELALTENSKIEVTVQVLVEKLVDANGKDIENAHFGLAIDGSASMKDLFGSKYGPFNYGTPNKIAPIAKSLVRYLSDFSQDNSVHCFYWSVGELSDEIEDLGKISVTPKNKPTSTTWVPRKKLGRKTLLLPVLEALEKSFKASAWSMGCIITDGKINDIEAVIEYTEDLTMRMKQGEVGFIKYILVGVGDSIDIEQMNELDNLRTQSEIDLWDTSYADQWEPKGIQDILKELMSDKLYIAESGYVQDESNKKTVLKKTDGFPSKFTFELSPNSTAFSIWVNNTDKPIIQDISEGIKLLKDAKQQ